MKESLRLGKPRKELQERYLSYWSLISNSAAQYVNRSKSEFRNKLSNAQPNVPTAHFQQSEPLDHIIFERPYLEFSPSCHKRRP